MLCEIYSLHLKTNQLKPKKMNHFSYSKNTQNTLSTINQTINPFD
jgi:hypothetical protein